MEEKHSLACSTWYYISGWGGLLLRIILGTFFLINGIGMFLPKVGHLKPTMSALTAADFSPFLAYVIGGGELVIGLCMILGVVTEIAGLLAFLLVTFVDPHFWMFFTMNWTSIKYLDLGLFFLAFLNGPGFYALWDPFKSQRARYQLFKCGEKFSWCSKK